jgi:integrase
VDRGFVPFFAPSAFSGLRRQEIIRLDWSEVKLDRDLIDLPFAKSKNSRRKLIEVSENLKQWLSPFARGIRLRHTRKSSNSLSRERRRPPVSPFGRRTDFVTPFAPMP